MEKKLTPRYLKNFGDAKSNGTIDKKSFIFMAYKNFADIHNSDQVELKFSLTKIYHYYNRDNKPVITCFRVKRMICSPLFPEGGDFCNYYIITQMKWNRWWNVNEFDTVDEGDISGKASVYKYAGTDGIVVNEEIINAVIEDVNGMSALVVGFPSDTTSFDQYNKPILNEHFGIRYEYSLKQVIKDYVKKYPNSKFISKFGIKSVGIPSTLFMKEDPFSNF